MATITANHYTDSLFNSFDLSHLGENTDNNASSEALAATAHIGFWFNADGNGSLESTYKHVMECELEIENPYTDAESLADLACLIDALGMTGEEFREMLIEQGYDGIIVGDEEFGGLSYVVFTPDQITVL